MNETEIKIDVSEWRPEEVATLRAILKLGPPSAVLRRARELTAEGRTGATAANTYAPTGAECRAVSDLLTAYRSVGAMIGVRVLPPPGSVHASVAEVE